ncbi:hypothetical protein SteCoe_17110 [Stentor coeruleus]|uniref:Uncharacterized protein n=1 Tax=Stentor coeruleus TaxID=5963 RepID=A0A1R2BZP8_9CILI|nr:hypothetical protein SteCoe_17110 [Stentor coeruleus]
MDIFCNHSNCSRKAKWECPENLKFCESHMREHLFEKNCYAKPVITRVEAKKKFNRLKQQSVQLAEIMINEISNTLEMNFADIENKINQMMDLLNKRSEEANNIILLAEKFNLLDRDKTQFIHITKSLFCLENNSIDSISELKQVKKENEELKNKCNESYVKIIEKENELNMYKEKYQVKQNELMFYAKKYNEANMKFLSTKNILNDYKDMQEKIDMYETENALNIEKLQKIHEESKKDYESACKKSLDEANDRIKKLENDIEDLKLSLKSADIVNNKLRDELLISENMIQEKIEEFTQYENYKRVRKQSIQNLMKSSLEEANFRIKCLENELHISQESLIKASNKIKMLEDELSTNKKSLIEVNCMVKMLQDESENLRLKPNPVIINIVKENTRKKDEKIKEDERKKEKEEEKKRKFISKLQTGEFPKMNQEQKSNYLLKEEFLNFKNDIIDKRQPILNIKMTNNHQYIFVCNHKADCINNTGMII